MNKIGLITLHDHNYGSTLQCFATQDYLKRRGFVVDVINQVPEYSHIKRYANRLWELFKMCVSHPLSAKTILLHFKSQRSSALRITKNSEKEIGRFNASFINNIYHTYTGLEQIGRSEEYAVFLSGSDQVWNANRMDFYDLFFLRFAPLDKRIAWAASFGGNKIAPYNKRRYARFLSEYKEISVRETSAVKIVQELTNKEATCLADPVTLLNGEQWRDLFIRYGSKNTFNGKYILFFFLDTPSDHALHMAEMMSKQTGQTIVTFGYKHTEIENHIDGGPWEFLSMIDGAECVFTDSFHAMVFSLLLHKRFFVFDRQYVHKQSQASRIVDLLFSVGLYDRFEPKIIEYHNCDFSKADKYFEEAKVFFEVFFSKVFEDFTCQSKEINNINTVKDYMSQCCGCSACEDICHVKAITKKTYGMGHNYPHIDSALCTNCGACQKVCSFKPIEESSFKKKGYVVCGKDARLIKDSASGGAIATIAKSVIEQGGVVYGASLWMDNGKVKCKHIAVDTVEELYRIQGSKYVQSSTQGVFPVIRELLKADRLVLFGGTSCQVAALKGFLKKDYDNLLTVDLICHGVPSLPLLQDYLDYQNKEFKAQVVDFRFRVREGRDKPYITTTTTRDSNGKIKKHRVSLRNSAFYRLFMGRSGYRPSCYNCPFASINKPADITVGDYYLSYEETDLKKVFANNELLSTLIVHNERGQKFIDGLSDTIVSTPISIDKLINRHEQLQSPSQATTDGTVLLSIYKDKGFDAVQKAVNKRNIEMIIPSLLKKVMIHK